MHVGDQAAAVVDLDHADAAGFAHRAALVDAVVLAAVADHDLAGHLGRIEHGLAAVERGAVAQGEAGGVGARQADSGGVDHRLGRQRFGIHRGAGVFLAVAQGDGGLELAVMGRGADRGVPRADVGHLVARAVVAGRSHCNDAGIGGAEESLLDRIGEGGAAADREVDHVDAVSDGLLNGRHAVANVAAVAPADGHAGVDIGPAHLVGSEACARGDARHLADVDAGHGHVHAVVAAGGGRGVGAMAAFANVAAQRIARRGAEFAPVGGAAGAQVDVVEVLRADQLVVAVGRGEAFAGLAIALPARWRRRIGQAAAGVVGRLAVGVHAIGVGCVLWPDAAVDDADDDVFAGLGQAAELGPGAVRTGQLEEVAGRDGGQFARHVGRDRQHVAAADQGAHFGVGQHGGEAVEHHLVVVHDGSVADGGAHGGLLLGQVAAVELDAGAVQVEALAGARLGGGQAVDAAVIGGDRLVGQLHDIGAARVVGLG